MRPKPRFALHVWGRDTMNKPIRPLRGGLGRPWQIIHEHLRYTKRYAMCNLLENSIRGQLARYQAPLEKLSGRRRRTLVSGQANLAGAASRNKQIAVCLTRLPLVVLSFHLSVLARDLHRAEAQVDPEGSESHLGPK